MSVSVTLPDDLASRLTREAERRHMTPELAVSVRAEHIPAEVSEAARAAMNAFIGVGASDGTRRAADVEDSMGAARFWPLTVIPPLAIRSRLDRPTLAL